MFVMCHVVCTLFGYRQTSFFKLSHPKMTSNVYQLYYVRQPATVWLLLENRVHTIHSHVTSENNSHWGSASRHILLNVLAMNANSLLHAFLRACGTPGKGIVQVGSVKYKSAHNSTNKINTERKVRILSYLFRPGRQHHACKHIINQYKLKKTLLG